MAATGKGRGRKPAVNDVAAKLQEAMKFLAVGYKASGNTQATHTWFSQGWGCSFDGIVAACVPIEGIDFEAYVNTALLIDALKHVGKELQITVTDAGLHLVSGDYDVTIPQGNQSDKLPTPPDPKLADLDARFKAGMEIAGRCISDTAPDLRSSCLMTRDSGNGYAYTVVAANQMVAVEAKVSDGAMPPGIVMPKQFVNALVRSGVDVAGWGFSELTFTAHMSNGGYIRTQRYLEDPYTPLLPQIDKLLAAGPVMAPPPKGFFEAVEAVTPFGDGTVYFVAGNVCAAPSVDFEEWGALVAVDKLPEGCAVRGKAVLLFREETQAIYLGSDADPRLLMYGELFRAVVGGNPATPAANPPAPMPAAASGWGTTTLPAFSPPNGWDNGDEIPF